MLEVKRAPASSAGPSAYYIDERADAESTGERQSDSIQTLVAIREKGEWKLAAFQNTRVRPMARNFASVLVWTVTDWLWKPVLRRR